MPSTRSVPTWRCCADSVRATKRSDPTTLEPEQWVVLHRVTRRNLQLIHWKPIASKRLSVRIEFSSSEALEVIVVANNSEAFWTVVRNFGRLFSLDSDLRQPAENNLPAVPMVAGAEAGRLRQTNCQERGRPAMPRLLGVPGHRRDGACVPNRANRREELDGKAGREKP